MAFRDIQKTNQSQLRGATVRTLKVETAAKRPLQYNPPGNLSDLNSDSLKIKWNELIAAEYDALSAYHSRFFALDPKDIATGQDFDAVRWASDPAEPNFCFDVDIARRLSDWRLREGHPIHSALSVRGRRETHNEYCEYRIVFRTDPKTGAPRAKRLIFTTELREYWMLLAVEAPERLQHAASEIVGREVTWTELYGPGVSDPQALNAEERLLLFATWTSGGAGRSDLLQAGVPIQPIGALNNEPCLSV